MRAAVIIPGLAPPNPAHGEALGDLVLFQLSEYRQNTDHGPAKRGGRVEIFIDGNKVCTVSKQLILDQSKCVFLRAGKTIQFINYHGVYAALTDGGKHLL